MTTTVSVDMSDLNDLIQELGEGVEHAVRPAAQAGADVIYRQAKQNAGAIKRKTGNLAASIYQAFDANASAAGHAVYNVSWNSRRAPHAYLVEFGHIQRYAVYVGKDGQWHTRVRPSAKGKPKPRRGASQAEKDAYYVLRQGGPKQIAASPFMRPAAEKADEAFTAAEAEFFKRINVQ